MALKGIAMATEDRIPATPGVIPPIGWILVHEMSSDKDFWVNPKSLKESPPTSELSEEQLERIKRIALCLQEHDSTPVEQWIENMRKDRYPEPEIQVWEEIIEVYQTELHERSSADSEERHHSYIVLLSHQCSMRRYYVDNVLSMKPATKSLPRLKQVIERFHLKRFG